MKVFCVLLAAHGTHAESDIVAAPTNSTAVIGLRGSSDDDISCPGNQTFILDGEVTCCLTGKNYDLDANYATLYLEDADLPEIPDLSGCKSVGYLQISHNLNITSVDGSRLPPQLINLGAVSTRITKFSNMCQPDSSSSLNSTLTTLDLRCSEISDVADFQLQHCSALTDIILDKNNIQNFDMSAFPLQLEKARLSLAYNQLTSLSFTNTTDFVLGELDLSHNTFSDFDFSWLPSGVQTLTMESNDIPFDQDLQFKTTGDSTRLTKLNLNYSYMTTLDGADLPSSLEELTVMGCYLESVSNMDKHNLTSLKTLDLNHNNIETQPDLQSCTNLTSINLSENKLTDKLDGSKFPAAAISIDVGGNDLSANSITSISGMASLVNLQELNLSWNNISDVSEINLQSNGKLTSLSLDGNPFTYLDLANSLPASTTPKFDLSLTGNSITSFPTSGAFPDDFAASPEFSSKWSSVTNNSTISCPGGQCKCTSKVTQQTDDGKTACVDQCPTNFFNKQTDDGVATCVQTCPSDFYVGKNSDESNYCLESGSAMTKQQYIGMNINNCTDWCNGLTMDNGKRRKGCYTGCQHKNDASTYNCKKAFKDNKTKRLKKNFLKKIFGYLARCEF